MTTKKAEATLEPMNIWQKLHAAKQQIGKVAKKVRSASVQFLPNMNLQAPRRNTI